MSTTRNSQPYSMVFETRRDFMRAQADTVSPPVSPPIVPGYTSRGTGRPRLVNVGGKLVEVTEPQSTGTVYNTNATPAEAASTAHAPKNERLGAIFNRMRNLGRTAMQHASAAAEKVRETVGPREIVTGTLATVGAVAVGLAVKNGMEAATMQDTYNNLVHGGIEATVGVFSAFGAVLAHDSRQPQPAHESGPADWGLGIVLTPEA